MGEEKNWDFFSSPITGHRVVIPWGEVIFDELLKISG
jgi:hypothetical protein